MGQVAVALRVMPESPDVDLEKIKKEIEKKFKIQDAKIEPVAFGLKSLKILLVKPDTGGTDDVEDFIRKIPDVQDVEVESVTLV